MMTYAYPYCPLCGLTFTDENPRSVRQPDFCRRCQKQRDVFLRRSPSTNPRQLRYEATKRQHVARLKARSYQGRGWPAGRDF